MPETYSFRRNDVHLLAGPDHSVAFAGGPLDAGWGIQLLYEPLSRCVLRLSLLLLLFEDRDLGTVLKYVLERWDIGGEEEADEGRVDHDHQRPQSPWHVHPGLAMLPLTVLSDGGHLDDVRGARHGPRGSAGEDDLIPVLEVSDLPGGLDGLPEAVLQGACLFPVDRDDTPHKRQHPDRVLDGAYGQDLVRWPEAGNPYAREPCLGGGQDCLRLQVFGEL